MRVYKCNFCGAPIYPGEGIMYVKADGTVLRYCSHKCFVSATKYGRDPRDLAWVRKRSKKPAAK
ncbi:50S ribosomal protein L24e [Thermoproteus tenax]|uniref:Large ribosomal subunit protein eL24 n=1 Tax=Thermoproteus tenax (strain ATCC 35583 / DSM 2078 / JCM 9277 / NBRC 100435 / Kra 1) TaxID=768679 RepID=G4RM19_THETK|nr:50S ribosomal protein L24e [Thermoproteus tenax]CCC82614.1 putative 50S ribosomal protein L24e [Thermoproteus tenax Kra 1]